jgi:hypothetical protein
MDDKLEDHDWEDLWWQGESARHPEVKSIPVLEDAYYESYRCPSLANRHQIANLGSRQVGVHSDLINATAPIDPASIQSDAQYTFSWVDNEPAPDPEWAPLHLRTTSSLPHGISPEPALGDYSHNFDQPLDVPSNSTPWFPGAREHTSGPPSDTQRVPNSQSILHPVNKVTEGALDADKIQRSESINHRLSAYAALKKLQTYWKEPSFFTEDMFEISPAACKCASRCACGLQKLKWQRYHASNQSPEPYPAYFQVSCQ